MLVLSRNKDQSIIINGDIKVTVVDVRGDKVRLGIEAPENVIVHREEVQYQIEAKMNPGILTCKYCARRNKCEWVDDPYNTGGDCLAAK